MTPPDPSAWRWAKPLLQRLILGIENGQYQSWARGFLWGMLVTAFVMVIAMVLDSLHIPVPK